MLSIATIIKNVDLRVTSELVRNRKTNTDLLTQGLEVPYTIRDLDNYKSNILIFLKNEHECYEYNIPAEFKEECKKRYLKSVETIKKLTDYKRIVTEMKRHELFLKLLYEYLISDENERKHNIDPVRKMTSKKL